MAAAEESQTPSSWLYPDRDAWEQLLSIRPKPRPTMEKPHWWQGRWPLNRITAPEKPTVGPSRILATVRQELAWARRCFYYAQSVLPASNAKDKAGRIADEISRARHAVDTPAKAVDVRRVLDELTDVGRYDPARHPRAFVETAGRSLALAGRVLEASRFAGLAYWGRVFLRAGGYFRAMSSELPSAGAHARGPNATNGTQRPER